VTLSLVLLFLSPLAAGIPMATLGAVLLVVAWTMGDFGEIRSILRLDLADRSVWLITFALTVVADLTVAVEVGITLAALLYIRRVTDTTTVSVVTPEYIVAGRAHTLQDKDVPPYVTILRIHGPFLFGMTDKLLDATTDLAGFQPIVVVRLRNMTAIDATGLHALEHLHDRLVRSGRHFLLCGLRSQPAEFLAQAEFVEHIGEENILPNVQGAIERARSVRLTQLAASGELASPGPARPR
jgi:SulP family sulfate permease